MREAARTMGSALAAVREHCRVMGIPVEGGADPNGTCLIGPEQTELFTSLGDPEAKRTTTDPDAAGLLVYLLAQAGVGDGDRVAVGASGSFPGGMIAALVAVEALGAVPVPSLSLGASSFGATRPDFNLLDLYQLLERGGFVSVPPAAVSLGGSRDVGGEFDPGFRESLLRELRSTGLRVLEIPGLRENVAERMALYGSVAAFVNVGGADASIGTSPLILNLPAGLVGGGDWGGPIDLPSEDQRGVLFEMLARGVPVLHLLHVRGLALRYGLPWDPIPLPEPGSTPFRDAHRGKGTAFWLLTLGYLCALALLALPARVQSKGRETVR
jgi:poly-gamma-glutamate system protein